MKNEFAETIVVPDEKLGEIFKRIVLTVLIERGEKKLKSPKKCCMCEHFLTCNVHYLFRNTRGEKRSTKNSSKLGEN